MGRWAEVAARAKEDTAEAEQGWRVRWTIDDGMEAGIVVEGDSEAVRVEASEESIVPVALPSPVFFLEDVDDRMSVYVSNARPVLVWQIWFNGLLQVHCVT